MKKIAFALILTQSVTALAQDPLLQECRNFVASYQRNVQSEIDDYGSYNKQVVSHKAEAARIVRADQEILENLLIQTYKQMPTVASYVKSVRDLPSSSPLRAVLRRSVVDLSQDAQASLPAVARIAKGFTVNAYTGSISLFKDYEIGGIKMRVSAQGIPRMINDQLHLLVDTSAHGNGPVSGVMTSGMKILNLNTDEDVQLLKERPHNWGGLIEKKALEEPFTRWQRQSAEIITNREASASSELNACQTYIQQHGN